MEDLPFFKTLWKNYKLPIIIIPIIGLLFPFLLNLLLLIKINFPIVGKPEDWLLFWATYLSAMASMGMIALTAISLFYNNRALKQNKEQLMEMKRQWEEEHKPNISVSYNFINSVAYLRIVNTSIVEIKKLRMKGEFYDGVEKSDYFDFSPFEKFEIDIEPHGIRNIVLHDNIARLTSNFYFIINFFYNEKEQKRVKVYCNEVYSVGDDIIWKKLIEGVNKLKQ